MKIRVIIFSLSLFAAVFAVSQGSIAEAANKHKTDHEGAHHPHVYVGRKAPIPGHPGSPQGYVQGIGPIWYGDGVNGPPNGGAYTTYPTNDPSIGWFPGLWDAQRRGDCIIDDGYGRWSGCDGR